MDGCLFVLSFFAFVAIFYCIYTHVKKELSIIRTTQVNIIIFLHSSSMKFLLAAYTYRL